MQTLDGSTFPIKLWANPAEVEAQALEQLRHTANLPFLYKHLPVMPDVHYGIGATVGSVVPTKGAIVPAAVGVDIGCGVCFARLPYKASQLPDSLDALFSDIASRVPVGDAKHQNYPDVDLTIMDGVKYLPEKVRNDAQSVIRQIGTLGSGNHFIEVCLDQDESVCIMLHSGSRGIGNKIGRHYIDRAKKIAELMEIELADPNLAYLSDGTSVFNSYWRDLQWAQRYAMLNRATMMAQVLRAVSTALGLVENAEPDLTVNCHHNYAEREEHFGESVIVTRKGAVRARAGDFGVIPGSMGTKSYVVQGLGNPESFCSCSHGAGRKMSRTKAREVYTLEDLATQTRGVVCKKDESVLDEIPGAYKDIDDVMTQQSDLVRIVATLSPILCLKG